jgi:hypothetical protein
MFNLTLLRVSRMPLFNFRTLFLLSRWMSYGLGCSPLPSLIFALSPNSLHLTNYSITLIVHLMGSCFFQIFMPFSKLKWKLRYAIGIWSKPNQRTFHVREKNELLLNNQYCRWKNISSFIFIWSLFKLLELFIDSKMWVES